jgi:hypothetical protein
MTDKLPDPVDLPRLRARLEEKDGWLHEDVLDEEFGIGYWSTRRSPVTEVKPSEDIPAPPTCVFCNAPWTPEMIELVELSGYCSTCADSERVIDVFCSTCSRLVYRKEVR